MGYWTDPTTGSSPNLTEPSAFRAPRNRDPVRMALAQCEANWRRPASGHRSCHSGCCARQSGQRDHRNRCILAIAYIADFLAGASRMCARRSQSWGCRRQDPRPDYPTPDDPGTDLRSLRTDPHALTGPESESPTNDRTRNSKNCDARPPTGIVREFVSHFEHSGAQRLFRRCSLG
jgi:hypothetical protein